MTTLQIEIPDELAQAAEREGLLTPQALEAMLRDMLRRDAGKRLIEMTEALRDSFSFSSQEQADNFVQSAIDEVRSQSHPPQCI